MKKQLFWGLLALTIFVGFLVHKDTTSAQDMSADAVRSPSSPSSLLLTEDFSYTVGTALNGTNGWSAHSGAGTNPITVTSPGLTYSGYGGSGIDNAVTLTTSGEDENKPLTATATSGTVYAAAMVDVTAAQTTGDYFFHLFQSSTVFYGRVFAKKDSTTTNYAFGIVKTSPGAVVYQTGFPNAVGSTHLVVVKYTFNSGTGTDDTVDLFVDPTLGGSEPSPTITADNTTTALTDSTGIVGIALRQGSSTAAANVIVDGIRVGTTWADVAGSSATPTPAPTPAPAVSSVSPTSGPATGGTSVTITGTNFTGVTAVKFGATNAASFTFNSATSITATSPAGTGTVDVTVTTPSGTSATSANDQFTFTAVATPTPAPSVTGVSPTSGTTAGATSVAISGTNFTGVSGVSFGGTAAASFSVNSATSITAISPAHAAGTVDITVTTSGGTSATSVSDQFTFTIPATPTPVPTPTVSPYAGTWQFTHTSKTITNTTCDPNPVGTTQDGPNFTIDNSGQFSFNAGNSLFSGSVHSDGSWSATIGASNGCTSPGTASGSCSSTSFCSGTYSYSGNTGTISFTSPPVPHPQHIVDFDGDGKTDFSVVRDPSNGSDPNAQATWWTQPSSNPSTTLIQNWGVAGDQYAPADFDGDHKTDYAIWRGPTATDHAAFWILKSLDGTVSIIPFGLSGDDSSVVGDYDGDGKADVAIFRANPLAVDPTVQAEWWFQPSSGPNAGKDTRVLWGVQTDFPIPGDYIGDSKADMAIGRNNGDGTITIWIHQGDGTDNPNTPEVIDRWGTTSDFYVPGDYDGDGKTDYAIVRSNGTNLEWWVRWSSDHSVHVAVWGVPADLQNAVQGDYDGDGKTDIGIWRRSDATFYIIGSKTGAPMYLKWGVPGTVNDTPTANYNER